ncbi:MAG: hypothetical protein ACI33M_08020 [Lysinibacillus sp.]
MKRLLLIAGILCLAGCTEEDVAQTPDASTEEIEQPTVSTSQQQLGDVLEHIAQRLGTMPNNTSYYSHGFGLVHADLIDLDQDGQNEMYVLWKGTPYFEEELTHRNQDSYIFEIWAANDKADEAQLLINKAITLDSSQASDLSISFVKSNSGELFVKTKHFQITEGTNYDQSTYYAYRNGIFDRTLESYQASGEINEQRLDMVEVDLQTFQAEMKKYEGEETFVVESKVGEKAFGFDTANISEQIGNVFTALTEGFNTFLTDGEDASSEDFEQIQKEMKDYKFYRTMDKRDASTYTSVINGLILYRKVEQDGGNLDYFAGYTEAQIAEKMKQLFDIDLDVTKLSLPSPNNPSQTELLHYENGVFYMPPTDGYGDFTMRDVTAAKKVTDHTYLVTFTDAFFDLMAYHDANYESQFDPSAFENIPIAEWPEDTHEFITTGIPSYAVVKLVDGTMQLHYIGYRNLTEQELKSF